MKSVSQARQKREKFKAKIRAKYKHLLASGMDANAAKLHILKTRIRLNKILTIQQLRDILYRTK